MDSKVRKNASAQEVAELLFYLVGSKTDELMNDDEFFSKLELKANGRDDAYIEMTIMNMFIVIKQYTSWEQDESKYAGTLDQMHFLWFHQLKQLSNYDEDDIEQLHATIFERYDDYSDYIEHNADASWKKSLAEAVLDNINDQAEQREQIIAELAGHFEKFYKSIPIMLRSL